MKFLAVDTSGKYMSVVAYCDGAVERVFLPECAMKHSVELMGEIDRVFARSHMKPNECDFFAVVVGPGSFTGIRIGISTVKGLCFACGKPALAITSLEALAYAERNDLLALVDAGRSCYYACAYDGNKAEASSPAYLSGGEVGELAARGFRPIAAEALFEGCGAVDPCEGLLNAVIAKKDQTIPAEELSAVYLRKSSAEEHRA